MVFFWSDFFNTWFTPYTHCNTNNERTFITFFKIGPLLDRDWDGTETIKPGIGPRLRQGSEWKQNRDGTKTGAGTDTWVTPGRDC